jgi:DNA-binding NarL/FixJ family response regulator
MSISVLIVDDQALVRAGFHMILDAEPGVDVVGEAADGVEAVALAGKLRPDVVLMDIRMPNMDGLAATREIMGAAGTLTRVIVLTTFDLDDYIYEALRVGASGFLLKDTPPEQLVEAIRIVAAGEALLSPSVTRRVIAEFAGRPDNHPVPPRGYADLTDREREVLELMARGMSNAEIAAHLVVSETTVKTHVARVLSKLNLRDRVQAVVLAYESGLVQPGAADGR